MVIFIFIFFSVIKWINSGINLVWVNRPRLFLFWCIMMSPFARFFFWRIFYCQFDLITLNLLDNWNLRLWWCVRVYLVEVYRGILMSRSQFYHKIFLHMPSNQKKFTLHNFLRIFSFLISETRTSISLLSQIMLKQISQNV